MLFHPSNLVWGPSMRSGNTTKCAATEFHQDLADVSNLAKPRCRRKTQGPYAMAHQVREHRDDNKPRHQSRGGSEARTVDKVGIGGVSCRYLQLIIGRSLEGVWKRAQAMSGKGKLVRFLDRMRDFSAIVKLAEELRQVILIYQVGSFINSRHRLG